MLFRSSSFVLCYRFLSESPIAVEREIKVYGVETDLNAYSFINMVSYFHLEAIPTMTANDMFTFVKDANACPTDDAAYTLAKVNSLNEFMFSSSTISSFVLCYKFAVRSKVAAVTLSQGSRSTMKMC